jgi:RNA polymerase sigma factor for flagellar operon FliA
MTNIEELWKLYKKTNDDTCRDELVKNYLPLVKYLTDRVAQHLPQQVRDNDREDLYIEGIIGLMDAIEKFDLSKKIKFETYASKRVRGSIIDTLRREDILPKNVREQAKKIEKAYIKLESEYGRRATDDEIAEELKMTKEAFYDTMDKIKGISIISMDSDFLNSNGDSFSLADIIGREDTALTDFEKKDSVAKLAELIEKLDTEERIVLETYYWDGLTLKEIGKVLNVSESRICQIHTKIVLKLRSGFIKLEKER